MTDPTPFYTAAAWHAGFAPLPDTACPQCSGGNGTICSACAGELAAKLRDPDDELVSVYYSGHGINHGTYRADIRFGGVL